MNEENQVPKRFISIKIYNLILFILDLFDKENAKSLFVLFDVLMNIQVNYSRRKIFFILFQDFPYLF
jgi:hypothetical protein